MARNNSAVLLHKKMMDKHRQMLENAVKGVRGLRPDAFSPADRNGAVHMSETRIYVGLNDSETREQIYETERYLDILKKICRNCHVAFSVEMEEGGYYHEDGEYVEEKSLCLVLIDVDKEAVQRIAKDLCSQFNQESVLVTENIVGGYFIGSGGE